MEASAIDDYRLRQFYIEIGKSGLYGGGNSFDFRWPVEHGPGEHLEMALQNGAEPENEVLVHTCREDDYDSFEPELQYILGDDWFRVSDLEVSMEDVTGLFLKSDVRLSLGPYYSWRRCGCRYHLRGLSSYRGCE